MIEHLDLQQQNYQEQQQPMQVKNQKVLRQQNNQRQKNKLKYLVNFPKKEHLELHQLTQTIHEQMLQERHQHLQSEEVILMVVQQEQ